MSSAIRWIGFSEDDAERAKTAGKPCSPEEYTLLKWYLPSCTPLLKTER